MGYNRKFPVSGPDAVAGVQAGGTLTSALERRSTSPLAQPKPEPTPEQEIASEPELEIEQAAAVASDGPLVDGAGDEVSPHELEPGPVTPTKAPAKKVASKKAGS